MVSAKLCTKQAGRQVLLDGYLIVKRDTERFHQHFGMTQGRAVSQTGKATSEMLI